MIRVRGIGRVYWGVEHDSQHPDRRPVASAFLVESFPPYRHSTKAVRFRLGNKELHVGLCKLGADPEQARPTQHSDPEVAEELRRIYASRDWWLYDDVAD